jgi:hypothetical protein
MLVFMNPGIDEAEHAFAAKHNGFSVHFIPGVVFLAEVQPLFDHLGRQERPSRGAARRQAQPDLANFLCTKTFCPVITLAFNFFTVLNG